MNCRLFSHCWIAAIVGVVSFATSAQAQATAPADTASPPVFNASGPAAVTPAAPVQLMLEVPAGVRPLAFAGDSTSMPLAGPPVRRMERAKIYLFGGIGAAAIGLAVVGGDVGGGIAVAGMLVSVYGLYSLVK